LSDGGEGAGSGDEGCCCAEDAEDGNESHGCCGKKFVGLALTLDYSKFNPRNLWILLDIGLIRKRSRIYVSM
jgi:hypothetical protein